MATAQEIIDNSLARLKDADESEWVDATLLALLNKGVAYVHQLLIKHGSPLAMKEATFDTVADTEAYTLSDEGITDLWGLVEDKTRGDFGVWFTDSDSHYFLEPCDKQKSIEYTNADSGTPAYYYLTATQIGFLPVPDSVVTMHLRYYCQHTALALGGTMPYNGLFDEALSVFMSNMAMLLSEFSTLEMTAIYNELEATALGIARNRLPKRPRPRGAK